MTEFETGLQSGLHRGAPLVQSSYMPQPPVPARKGRYTVSHLAMIVRNIPPARIWAYQRASETNTLDVRAVPAE